MSLVKKINSLIDSHPGTYTSCLGCGICQEIQAISSQWKDDATYPEHVRRVLEKRADITREDVVYLLQNGVQKRQIAKAIGIAERTFYKRLRKWGLNREKKKEVLISE